MSVSTSHARSTALGPRLDPEEMRDVLRACQNAVAGDGAAQEQAVVGGTPDLAARVQGVAEPGTVVIADVARRLLGEVFEIVALEP